MPEFSGIDPSTNYGSGKIYEELGYSKEVFKKYRAHVINITDKSIEETAFLIEDHWRNWDKRRLQKAVIEWGLKMEQYKRILLKEFDSRQEGHYRANQPRGNLNLPKGTELYISDIHGGVCCFWLYFEKLCKVSSMRRLRTVLGTACPEVIRTACQRLFLSWTCVGGKKLKAKVGIRETVPQLLNLLALSQVPNTVGQGRKALPPLQCHLYYRGTPPIATGL